MSSTINLTLKLNVVGGPSILVTRGITVEAYDKIDVTVGASDSDKVVEIQPGASSQVQMLLIKSSEYGTDLTYKVQDAGATPIVLDQDQLFLGQGAVGLLGTQIDRLLFTNNLGNDVTIEILVGRDATP
ncbi:MAG TPA: hypothetical protein ENI58_06160 [Nitrospirae bacterium]|nr:hypothetical protein [Nitrospirota bacterium]